MYALHPGSLPPHGAKAKERLDVSADDLIALYGIVDRNECIVWDSKDGYDWFDFIHLYPSYYDRYTLKRDGTPEKDVPECVTPIRSFPTASSSTRKTASPRPIHCAKTKH
jgi:hypothetical protein